VLESLMIAGGMIALTVFMHFLGLAGLIHVLSGESARRIRAGDALLKALTILFVVFGLIALHGAEMWAYAFLFLALDAFATMEEALYFSITSFTTVGYGDLVIASDLRLIGALEAVNGFILIGWSTAFLVSVTARMGLLEAQLEEAVRAEAKPGLGDDQP
jgi:hypothetical protein